MPRVSIFGSYLVSPHARKSQTVRVGHLRVLYFCARPIRLAWVLNRGMTSAVITIAIMVLISIQPFDLKKLLLAIAVLFLSAVVCLADPLFMSVGSTARRGASRLQPRLVSPAAGPSDQASFPPAFPPPQSTDFPHQLTLEFGTFACVEWARPTSLDALLIISTGSAL